jgi:hypothetical protein
MKQCIQVWIHTKQLQSHLLPLNIPQLYQRMKTQGYGILLHNPKGGDRTQRASQFYLYLAGVDPSLTEIVIFRVAAARFSREKEASPSVLTWRTETREILSHGGTCLTHSRDRLISEILRWDDVAIRDI